MQLTKKNYDFFPLNRALSLQQELDENEIRLETLVDQVSYLVNKTKQEASLTYSSTVLYSFAHLMYV